MSFLKAEWRKLAFANYVVDSSALEKYLPAGTELDLWNGKCYVSLVGFMFNNTRILGVKIPFHVNFEEVNLRFYVKRWDGTAWKNGVVFIKEIVPKAALAFVANTVYYENYETMPMGHYWVEKDDANEIFYKWNKNNQWHSFKIVAGTETTDVPAGTETEFITEHFWGYTRIDDSTSSEYEVSRTPWQMYNVKEYDIRVDFGMVYGSEFAFLNNQQPESVMLAEGSAITVEGKSKIKAEERLVG